MTATPPDSCTEHPERDWADVPGCSRVSALHMPSAWESEPSSKGRSTRVLSKGLGLGLSRDDATHTRISHKYGSVVCNRKTVIWPKDTGHTSNVRHSVALREHEPLTFDPQLELVIRSLRFTRQGEMGGALKGLLPTVDKTHPRYHEQGRGSGWKKGRTVECWGKGWRDALLWRRGVMARPSRVTAQKRVTHTSRGSFPS